MPSVLTFENKNGGYELKGIAKESETVRVYSDVFEFEETYFLHTDKFTQRIKVLDIDVKQISIKLNYQVCKKVCMNKEEYFTINLDGSKTILNK